MHVRMLLISTLIVPLSIGLALSRPETCLACSCVVQPTPAADWTAEQLTRDYEVVIRGYVIAADPLPDHVSNVVTMAASTVWAGPVRATYRVEAGPGNCAISFAPGQEWLIFAHETVTGREPISTSVCTRTMPVTDGRADFHASILGEGTSVVDVPRLKAVGAVPVMSESLVILLLLAAQLELSG